MTLESDLADFSLSLQNGRKRVYLVGSASREVRLCRILVAGVVNDVPTRTRAAAEAWFARS